MRSFPALSLSIALAALTAGILGAVHGLAAEQLLPGQLGPTIQLGAESSTGGSAVVATATTEVGLPPAMAALDDRQRLNPGDRISFRVVEDREDPKTLLVTDSGELEVPYVGRVKVGGKTCLQVAREARVLLEKDYYHQATPLIQIELLNRARGKVYVHGEVRRPGPQEIPSDEVLTVSKAILRAEGFNTFANKRKVIVTRRVPFEGASDRYEDRRYLVDVTAILEKGRTDLDMPLMAEDMIFVDSRTINF